MIINVTEQNYEYCSKMGFLSKYCLGIFRNSFVEKWAVLTNVGLLYYDEPGKVPKRLVTLVGCTIAKVL